MSTLIARLARAAVPAALVGAILGSGVPAQAAGDTSPPTLTGLRIAGAPFTANVTTGVSNVGVTVHATDATGVGPITVTASCVTSCVGTGDSSVQGFSSVRNAGPTTNTGRTVSLDIPPTAQTGGWQVTEVDLADTASPTNSTAIAALSAFDATRGFTVTKTTDSAGPTVSGNAAFIPSA